MLHFIPTVHYFFFKKVKKSETTLPCIVSNLRAISPVTSDTDQRKQVLRLEIMTVTMNQKLIKKRGIAKRAKVEGRLSAPVSGAS